MAKLFPDTNGNFGRAGYGKEVAGRDSADHVIGRLATVAGLVQAETRREDPPHRPADGLPRDGGSAASGINRYQPLPHDRPANS